MKEIFLKLVYKFRKCYPQFQYREADTVICSKSKRRGAKNTPRTEPPSVPS